MCSSQKPTIQNNLFNPDTCSLFQETEKTSVSHNVIYDAVKSIRTRAHGFLSGTNNVEKSVDNSTARIHKSKS